MLTAIELYAGAGGLAMGVSLAGFRSLAVVEWDKWACDTIRQNREREFPLVSHWPAPFEGDVRKFDWETIEEPVDLVAGGPPCQPFSMGGKHRANDDSRDMFPATVNIVKRLRPKAFIVENVKGLTRSTFANYYQYIKLQLEFPEAPSRKDEDWFDHLLRLQVLKSSAGSSKSGRALRYNLSATLINAADYGVPQKRERVFIVGFRADLDAEWSFPKPTHSYDALLHSQWVTGEYWDRHGIAKKNRPQCPSGLEKRIERLRLAISPLETKPWRTVRDALIGLPDVHSQKAKSILDHRFQDGAKVYPGHTGSPLDLPAKTIKAGDHGVPGGENMMVLADGSVRYLTIREAARVQTFPDGYVFHGSWSETMRQLGNAVPVALAQVVASSVAQTLLHVKAREISKSNVVHRSAA